MIFYLHLSSNVGKMFDNENVKLFHVNARDISDPYH